MIKFFKEECIGCKVCIKVCPHRVISMVDGRAEPVNKEKCIECGACELNCEYGAIKVTKGTGCLWAIIVEDILKIRSKGCSCG